MAHPKGILLNNFDDLKLIKPLRRALHEKKYTTPTPIQAQAIPPALEGNDVLGCAQTGTGKTAAFCIPLLNHLGKHTTKPKPNNPYVLIMVPTRELATQIGKNLGDYGKHLRVRRALVYGGVNQFGQVKDLKRGVEILVATPGRLIDLMNQGHIELDQLKMFVLDEVDRMLDMGFLPDIKRIISELPEERQSLFFSATLSSHIQSLADQLLESPVKVTIKPEERKIDQIQQKMLHLTPPQKQPVLFNLLDQEGVERTLIFTKTKRGAEKLSKQLNANDFKAAAIHGDKTQKQRERSLDAFRRRRVDILVATDVAARGIDITGITHVFNYDLPMEAESYVHRIGRTGRAGSSGDAISFCTSEEMRLLRDIERLIGSKVPVDPEFPAPERTERSEKRSPYSRRKGGGRGKFSRRPSSARRFKPNGKRKDSEASSSRGAENESREKSNSTETKKPRYSSQKRRDSKPQGASESSRGKGKSIRFHKRKPKKSRPAAAASE